MMHVGRGDVMMTTAMAEAAPKAMIKAEARAKATVIVEAVTMATIRQRWQSPEQR